MSELILNIINNIYVNKETKQIVNNIEPFKYITNDFKVDDNLFKININGYDIIKPIDWFIIYATYKPDYIINIDLNYLDFKEYKPHGVSKDINIMPIFIKPIEYVYNGIIYRLLSRYPGYAVDEYGNCINIITNTLIHTYIMGNISKRKYKFSSINDRYIKDKTRSVLIHKLVAIAWCANDDYVTRNIIDHKDNDSMNNHYTNLSWVSNKKNTAKVIYNTLDDIVLLRNIDTGEITEHLGTNEAYRYIGRSRGDSNNTPFQYGRIFIGNNGRYEMKLKSHKYGWKYSDNFKPEDVYLWTIEYNGQIRCFNSTHSAKKMFMNILKAPTGMTNEEFQKALSRIGAKYTYTNSAKPITYIGVKDIETEKVYETNSIQEASRIIGISRSPIERELRLITMNKDNIGRVLNNRYIVRPNKSIEWPDIKNYKFRINKPRSIIARCIDKDIVMKFNSIRHASGHLDKDQRTIIYYIKEKIPFENKKDKNIYKLYFE